MTETEWSALTGGTPTLAAADTLKGLIVFVRFKDDNRIDYADIAGPSDWPINTSATRRDALPPWAPDLVEDVGTGIPQDEGSLAHYFYYMSRGKFRFNCGYYDSTIVLDSTIVSYKQRFSGCNFTAINEARADALRAIAADTGFSLAPYLSDRSDLVANTLDYVCVVFRGAQTFEEGSGCDPIASLNSTQFASGCAPARGLAATGNLTLTRGGTNYYIKDWLCSWVVGQGSRIPESEYPNTPPPGAIDCESPACATCPVNGVSFRGFRGVITHEMGHSILAGDAPTIGGQHISGLSDWSIMGGAGGIMHGFERLQLGWVDPIKIFPGTNATIKAYDCVKRNAPNFSGGANDSTYYLIYPSAADTSQVFLLENRRASTVYGEPWTASSTYQVQGQPGNGLLITHFNRDGTVVSSSESLKKQFNIEVASGLWNTTFDPDPERGRSRISCNFTARSTAHNDDPFKPGNCTTLAPYTCPSTAMYDASDTLQSVHSGLAIMNIRNGADSSVVAEVRWGVPADSTTENVTWDNQVLLSRDFKLAVGDTISVEKEAKLLFRGGGEFGTPGGIDGKRVELNVKGVIDLNPGVDDFPFLSSSRDTALRRGPKPPMQFVRPLHADSLPVTSPAPGTADWYGVRLPSIQSIKIADAEIKHARGALAMETDKIPRIANIEGTHLLSFASNLTKMSFDRDVIVAAESSVTVPNNFVIGFAANRDSQNQGSYATKGELIVRGNVDFNGADYYNRVVFMSDEADSAESYRKGDWGGMRLEAYGSCGSSRELDFTVFRDAVHGIAVQDTCLMKMNWPLFANNLTSDVYLDRDVRIPDGRRIDLRAPTRIVATAGSSAYDHLEGEDDLVDVLVYGDLVTRRPDVVPGSDWTIFESTSKDSVNGDDWGGLVVAEGGMGHIEDADLGFAVRPAYFAAADSAALVESKVHHYAEEGVLDWGSDARIEANSIAPGAQFDSEDDTNSGIHIVGSGGSILRNAIGQHTDYGIWYDGSDAFCMATGIPSTPIKTLLIEDNVITGSGEATNVTGSAGIYIEWLCQYYKGVVQADTLTQWSGRAVYLHQSADIDFNCNRIVDDHVGVRYFRDNSKLQSFEGKVRFKGNAFKGSRNKNVNVEGELGLALYDAGDASNTGDNTFQRDYSVQSPAPKNVTLNLLYDGSVDARYNAWLDSTGTVMTNIAAIEATNAPGIGEVLVDPPLSSQDLCSGSETVRVSAHGTEVTGDRGTQAVLARQTDDQLPEEWDLRVLGTGRTDKTAEFNFDVPLYDGGGVRLILFNVAGRRVHTLFEGAIGPGRYSKTWDGTLDSGGRAASGVYFARLDRPGGSVTRKLVYLK